MHNLSNEYYQNEFESSYELSPEFEFSNEYSGEFSGESAYELSPEYEFENLSMETYEAELAQELMEVNSEAEFIDWLKSTAKKAAGVASGFLDSPTGKKATQALTNIARKTLPGAGTAAGGFLGSKGGAAIGGAIGALAGPEGAPIGQAIGGWAGGKLGSFAGSKAGQWAADRFPSFVRFATDTIRDLANEVSRGGRPSVKNSVVKSAKRYYPIILKVRGTLHARPVRGKFFNSSFSSGSSDSSASQMNDNPDSADNELYGEIASNETSFHELTEMELASELLNIQSEAELDQFLGKLFKKAAGAVSKFAKSSTGKALGGMLKGLAKKALPIAGGAIGSFIAPGIGTAIGSQLGSMAGNLFELELEGLSAEDREFEVARAFVRFAGNAARRASNTGGHPVKAARNSIVGAARRYAPGLLVSNNTYNYSGDGSGDESGSWYRDGNRIVLEGV